MVSFSVGLLIVIVLIVRHRKSTKYPSDALKPLAGKSSTAMAGGDLIFSNPVYGESNHHDKEFSIQLTTFN